MKRNIAAPGSWRAIALALAAWMAPALPAQMTVPADLNGGILARIAGDGALIRAASGRRTGPSGVRYGAPSGGRR